MKKFYVLMIIIAMTATILPGCKKATTDDKTNSTNSGNAISSGTTAQVSCETSISDYLKSADKVGTGTRTIASGDKITVDYVGRLDKKTVFDTSVESVAKACDKYTAARNYNEGLSFSVGAGQMIAGFDKAVQGMKVGQTKTIEILPEDAYGKRNPANVLRITKDKFPNPENYKVGMKVQPSVGNMVFTITEITDKEIVLDANHELAGKTLIFDITIKSID